MPGGIPICVYESDLGLFRVLQTKGKSLSSGGFGVSMPDEAIRQHSKNSNGTCNGEPDQLAHDKISHSDPVETTRECSTTTSDADAATQDVDEQSKPKENSTSKSSSDFLFIEEAIFLHERGLLEVQKGQDKLDAAMLFDMLRHSDVSFPAYLVYAHLRSQTFVVIRHTPRRLDFLKQISQNQDGKQQQPKWSRQKRSSGMQALSRELRKDAFSASAPGMMKESCKDDSIAFDVYQPNANFRRTNPGPPDYYVAICSYSLPSPTVSAIIRLMEESCHGIPLRIATVADSGTVMMLSVTDFGIPTITHKEASES